LGKLVGEEIDTAVVVSWTDPDVGVARRRCHLFGRLRPKG
jgi:hypothetical protein